MDIMEIVESTKRIWSSIVCSFKRFFFRYSLVTELYMVESWEWILIDGIILGLIGVLFTFNYFTLIPIAEGVRDIFLQGGIAFD